MRLKIKGVLILCIVAVLANTCFEKFDPKVRRLVHNLIPVKIFVLHISQTIRRIEKNTLLTRSSFLQCIFIFCENLNFDIFIRSNVNGNLFKGTKITS